MCDAKEVEFSLKAMIDKEKTKVLFVEADSHFVDILLCFLTLPLGRIVKILDKHYGDEAPTIGSLSSLYHSLANLDNAHFWTEAAKQTLLNQAGSFEAEYKRLKLDITDSQPVEYFVCGKHSCKHRVRSLSIYHDRIGICRICYHPMSQEVAEKESPAASKDGVFTVPTASFIISDDLQILPNETGLLGIFSILGITDMDKAEPINVTFGINEIMSLLKASFTISQTPFSDIILNKTRQDKTRQANSVTVEPEPETSSLNQVENGENLDSNKIILKVIIQKSTGKLLYAQAMEDFIEFLCSFLFIPLGGVEHLLDGKTCIKAIRNLYRSTADLVNDKYFKTPDIKNRLIKPNVPHGCLSKNNILPLVEECLPASYDKLFQPSSDKFPKGKGNYLQGPRTYKVTDDLTVTPFCIVSIISSLNKQKIHLSDVKEVELQIGLKEGLSILKASLISTHALTDALLSLLTHTSNKRIKREV